MTNDPDRVVHRVTRSDGERSNVWVLGLVLALIVLHLAIATPTVFAW